VNQADWRRAQTLALDTSAFIYHLEDHSLYGPRVLPVFRRIEQGRCNAVTSTLTLLEVLVQPYRDDDESRRIAITGLLASFPRIRWVDLDLAVADRAAALRARYNLRVPDAIQVATAILAGADMLLTNDRGLRRIVEVSVVLIEDCTEP
jgi:predicted nucleic acid-binding protein